uniref:Immunoglobulin V-set domain-containing protein n=1 Tax=Seriola dumerili TaxID=41447 RepID=A0A3B4U036_SERDU
MAATWTEGAIINEEGFEGGEVSFQCSYKFAWKNDKYFCKDECKEAEDILATVKSEQNKDSWSKYSIKDEGNTFFVTISRLTQDDAGIYWCGIERVGFDTYNELHLSHPAISTITRNQLKTARTTVYIFILTMIHKPVHKNCHSKLQTHNISQLTLRSGWESFSSLLQLFWFTLTGLIAMSDHSRAFK